MMAGKFYRPGGTTHTQQHEKRGQSRSERYDNSHVIEVPPSISLASAEFDFALHTGVAKNPRRTEPGPIYTNSTPRCSNETLRGLRFAQGPRLERVRRRVPLERSQVLEVPVHVVTSSKANASLHFLHFQVSTCCKIDARGLLEHTCLLGAYAVPRLGHTQCKSLWPSLCLALSTLGVSIGISLRFSASSKLAKGGIAHVESASLWP